MDCFRILGGDGKPIDLRMSIAGGTTIDETNHGQLPAKNIPFEVVSCSGEVCFLGLPPVHRENHHNQDKYGKEETILESSLQVQEETSVVLCRRIAARGMLPSKCACRSYTERRITQRVCLKQGPCKYKRKPKSSNDLLHYAMCARRKFPTDRSKV